MFDVDEEIEYLNGDEWAIGWILKLDLDEIGKPVDDLIYLVERADGSTCWRSAIAVRASTTALSAEIWQFKSHGGEEWRDIDFADGTTFVFASYDNKTHVTFRRKPKHTEEEILAELRRLDAAEGQWSKYQVSQILRGDF